MRLWSILPAVAALAILSGCGGDGKQEISAEPPAANPSIVAQQAAETITARYQRDLKAAVLAAMNAGGAVYAITVCESKAPEIAAVHGNEGAWTITRVSDSPRVPSHMADAHQLEVLQKFADTVSPMTYYTEWITVPTGDSTFVYYEAIRIGEICTNCHGNRDKLAQGVPERLAELYPKDNALGYEVGDLRGMFVVTMNWPEALAPAQELIKPTSQEPAAEAK